MEIKKQEILCGIYECLNKAECSVTYVHPNPSSRWSANLCLEHMKITNNGDGELIFLPLSLSKKNDR